MRRRRLVLRAAAGCAVVAAALGAAVTVGPLRPAMRTRPAALGDAPALADIAFDKAGAAAFALLRDALKIASVNPRPADAAPRDSERGVAELFAARLAEDGIAAELWPVAGAAADRVSLMARLPATTAVRGPPLCLVSHLDVVPAEAAGWTHGPFAGDVADSGAGPVLYGRGALDMKGMAVLEVEVLRLLARHRVPRARDVVLLAVADEESGSLGMQDALAHHWDALGCGDAINEGGLVLADAIAPGTDVAGISVGEKGFAWLRVTVQGPPGHGSTQMPGRAPDTLRTVLDRVAARVPGVRVHESLDVLFAAVGAQVGGATGAVLVRPPLLHQALAWRARTDPALAALVTTSINLTGFFGAQAPNVVPSEVAAQLDARLPPGTTPADVVAELTALTADLNTDVTHVRVDVIHAQQAAVTPWEDSAVYTALARAAVRAFPNAAVGPALSPGYSDSILLRARGVRAFGFVPFRVTRAEAATMHGNDERVSLHNVTRGLELLVRAVVEIAGAP